MLIRLTVLTQFLTLASRGTIGGNGHENHTLLRLLPVLNGSKVPEGDKFWRY